MVFRIEPVERGANVVNLAFAAVVCAFAQAGSAEVEAQHRKSESAQGLHGVVDHLVVYGASKQRMRMAHQRRMARLRRPLIEQRLEPARGAVEKKSFDLVGHKLLYQKYSEKE